MSGEVQERRDQETKRIKGREEEKRTKKLRARRRQEFRDPVGGG